MRVLRRRMELVRAREKLAAPPSSAPASTREALNGVETAEEMITG